MPFAAPYLAAFRMADLQREAADERLIRLAHKAAVPDPVDRPRRSVPRPDPRRILALAAMRLSDASAATARRLDPCLGDRASRRSGAFGR
jgi:hypothetical protein